MLWIALVVLHAHQIYAGNKASSIICACTTTHCLEHNMQYCNTTGTCFSQYLDRHDGTHPLVRGCIKSKTPLLCENRRPAIPRVSWPLLLCCNTNLCNRDVVPTPPPWFGVGSETNETADETVEEHTAADSNETSSIGIPRIANSLASSDSFNPMFSLDDTTPSVVVTTKTKTRSSALPHIISPIYISVLVLGIISLVVIGIVAAIVLKRSNRFYMEQYGALEHQYEHGCLKHSMTAYPPAAHAHDQPCDCNSEVESLSQCSQAYSQADYQVPEAGGT